jgi:hypothetical protein
MKNMTTRRTWQQTEIERLSRLFGRKRQVRALLLSGSLASKDQIADEWSDVDNLKFPRFFGQVGKPRFW